MTNEDKYKKEYDLALLLKGEDDVAPVLALVGQHNGEGASEPRAKRLQLAYEIKGNTEAVFAYFTFKMFGDDAKAFEHDLSTRPGIIRFMVIASPAPAERAAVSPLPSREERHPRPTISPEASKPSVPKPLSNEALEKKIEEILQ
jgi:ribosomal protein S6